MAYSIPDDDLLKDNESNFFFFMNYICTLVLVYCGYIVPSYGSQDSIVHRDFSRDLPVIVVNDDGYGW